MREDEGVRQDRAQVVGEARQRDVPWPVGRDGVVGAEEDGLGCQWGGLQRS